MPQMRIFGHQIAVGDRLIVQGKDKGRVKRIISFDSHRAHEGDGKPALDAPKDEPTYIPFGVKVRDSVNAERGQYNATADARFSVEIDGKVPMTEHLRLDQEIEVFRKAA